MAILKIARMGHPVLLQRAAAVDDPAVPEIRRLVADMIETMQDAGGAGLAAPQVHVPLRLFVFRVPAARAAEAEAELGVQVLVNPELSVDGDEVALAWEGCLSIPGLQAEVPRPARIRYEGLDAEGQTVAREAGGFHARVVQHENDHLDGILYPMRMTDFSRFGFSEELARFGDRPGG
jgi:peptide deformylase